MLITNFSSGELSENLKGRTDLPQYYQGAAKIENFSVIPTGGIRRRVGFERLGELSGNCRLIPFIVDRNISFVLEFVPKGAGDEAKIRVWENGILTDEVSGGTEGGTIFGYADVAELNEIQYAQDFDRMIFVHRKHNPVELKYDIANRTFTASKMLFSFVSDVNITDEYGYIRILENQPANGDPERPYAIWGGKLYKFEDDGFGSGEWNEVSEGIETDSDLFTSENKFPGCVAFFNNRLFFAGTSEARQKAWASCAPGTKGSRYNQFSQFQKFVTVSKVLKDPDVHIFTADIAVWKMEKTGASNSDGKHDYPAVTTGSLATDDSTYRDGVHLVNISQDLSNGKLKTGDITDYYIYNPVYFPGGRRVKATGTDEKGNFQIIVDASILASAMDASDIMWIDGGGSETDNRKGFKALTFQLLLWQSPESNTDEDYEFRVNAQNAVTADCSFSFELASDQNDAIKWLASGRHLCIGTESSNWCAPATLTALDVGLEMSGRYGSDDLQAHCVGTAVVYFAQGKRGIREYYYDSQQEAFVTNNIAILAEHLLSESPAVDFDFMTNPYNRLLVTRADGKIAVMLYDKNNGVMAWSTVSHGGNAKIESVAVVRGDAESDIIYAAVSEERNGGREYFLERLDPASKNKVYLDGWRIENGQTVGEPFVSRVRSLPVLSGSEKKRIVSLLVRFNKSHLPRLTSEGISDEHFNTIETEPYSGLARLDVPGESDRDVEFELAIDKDAPCEILSINAATA